MTYGQCDARPAVTFPAAGHHRPWTGTKLYCLVTEAHLCGQLANALTITPPPGHSSQLPACQEITAANTDTASCLAAAHLLATAIRVRHRTRGTVSSNRPRITSLKINSTRCSRSAITLLYNGDVSVSGGSRIFARGVRQLVPLECPKPLHALSPYDR